MAVYMEGPLSKWTNVMKGWQYRWFVLDDNAGLLSYYTSKEKMMRGSRRGCVRLQDAIIGIDDEDDSTFTITVDQKVFHFQARDAEERKQWACALEDTILRHSQRQFESTPSPSLDEFDRRLAEADAYLQLLIENVKGVGSKVSAMDNEATEKQDLESILITAQEMVESVKKSIVLLQLAKTAVTANTATHNSLPLTTTVEVSANSSMQGTSPAGHSENPTENSSAEEKNESRSDASKADQLDLETRTSVEEKDTPINGNVDQAFEKESAPLTEAEPESVVEKDSGIKVGFAPQLESATVEVVVKPASEIPPTLLTIPATSYSSSEDEAEFYDADEDIRSIHSNRSKASGDEVKPKATEDSLVAKEDNIVKSNVEIAEADLPPPIRSHEDMYMKEENHNETEGESVEEHKSVIMHLLSQVKLGMDLTKVVLPTFILERRSLLEMYADFFSHCDYFIEIANKPTAEERMIACLRFYLSTFAAGRNSSVAKKPYNPILGETFQCFWDDPTSENGSSSQFEPVEDGPVPWAKSNQLSFLAEQVSHHPPVSAFYAEHKDKKIQFNGHIWTKSKFLGLSIGVHNIGQGCIRLLEHDEEYIINFPNGYGRSILTIPWVELGGDCTITCEKTGYNAFVKFHTKPFYGGKVHKVTAEVLQPNAKKPFCTVEGEWHTVMYASYSTGKNECFVDTKKSKYPKTVRKIEHQEPMESRRLWEKVTYNLKTNNIDEATNGKRFLEDRQRREAKERLQDGVLYKPNHFHEDDCQNWIFNSTLTDRT